MRYQKLYREAKVKENSSPSNQLLTNALKNLLVRNTSEGKDLWNKNPNNKVSGNMIIYINYYLKCKETKCSSQNKETGWMDIKTNSIVRDPLIW